eukprot:m.242098 g.242098  ORF g.242098 m.242098 type:complete len:173 (-) comp26325_c0_seq7:789-1307(-)
MWQSGGDTLVGGGFFCRAGGEFTSTSAVVKMSLSERSDQEVRVLDYFKEHSIPQLLENLTASLVYNQPESPREFLIEEIQRLVDARDYKTPMQGLIGKAELKAIFGVFDVSRTKCMSLEQYKEGMKAAGVPSGLFNDKPEGYLMGKDGKISVKTFQDEGLRSLARVNATYCA